MIDRAKSILIVDDIQPSRETTINILKALGFKKFLQAPDGQDALELLAKHHDTALIISDWKMPRLSGLELLKAVRRDKALSHIPFLMLTSKSESEDVALAADFDVTAYLVKPISVQGLLDKLQLFGDDNPDTLFSREIAKARTKTAEGDWYGAERLLTALLPAYPQYEARTLFELGRVFAGQRRWKEAEEMLENALRVSPLLAKAWKEKAHIQGQQKRWQEAEASMDQALCLSPSNAEYMVELGKTQLAQGYMEKAKTTFTKAMNINRRDDTLKQAVWDTYLAMDQLDSAQRDFGTQLTAGLSVEALNNTAVVMRKEGRREEAIHFYKLALAKDPENPKLHYNIAMAYVSLNKRDSAIRHLQHAVRIDPNFREAKSLLQETEDDGFVFSDGDE